MDSKLFKQNYVRWVNKRYFRNSKKGLLLDLGNGDGVTTKEFERLGYTAFGFDKELDLDKDFIDGLPPMKYDYIFSKSVIEHLKNPKSFLLQCNHLLKKKGKIFIHTPNIDNDKTFFTEDEEHISPFNETGLKQLLENTGFNILMIGNFRNIPYFWRYTSLAFDMTYFNSKAIICLAEKK